MRNMRRVLKTAYEAKHTHLFRADDYFCSACKAVICIVPGISLNCARNEARFGFISGTGTHVFC